MIYQLIPDIKRMLEISYKMGELRVEHRNACEIKRGKMPDENRLLLMREEENKLFKELLFLKQKWGISEKKY